MIFKFKLLLLFMMVTKVYSQNFFNEIFIYDTTIVLKTKELGFRGKYDFVATSNNHEIIFSDQTRTMKKNDSIPFLKYNTKTKTLSEFFVITNSNDLFLSKHSTLNWLNPL